MLSLSKATGTGQPTAGRHLDFGILWLWREPIDSLSESRCRERT